MSDTNQNLRIPHSRPVLIFERVARTLRASPKLACVKEWRVGDRLDTKPLVDATPGQCPMIRLTLDQVTGQGVRDNISQGGRLLIGVTIYVKGFEHADLLDLFMQVIHVVYPSGQGDEADYRLALQRLGAVGTPVDIGQWPVPSYLTRDGEPTGVQVGKGQLGITFRIQG